MVAQVHKMDLCTAWLGQHGKGGGQARHIVQMFKDRSAYDRIEFFDSAGENILDVIVDQCDEFRDSLRLSVLDAKILRICGRQLHVAAIVRLHDVEAVASPTRVARDEDGTARITLDAETRRNLAIDVRPPLPASMLPETSMARMMINCCDGNMTRAAGRAIATSITMSARRRRSGGM